MIFDDLSWQLDIVDARCLHLLRHRRDAAVAADLKRDLGTAVFAATGLSDAVDKFLAEACTQARAVVDVLSPAAEGQAARDEELRRLRAIIAKLRDAIYVERQRQLKMPAGD